MNFRFLSVLNFFKKKNRFRITAKLAEKESQSQSNQDVDCLPLGSVEYHLANMRFGPIQKKDFLSSLANDATSLRQSRQSSTAGQSHWHQNKYTQAYQSDQVALNPQIEIYYKKLGLAQSNRKTPLGEPKEVSWDS